MNDFEKLVKLKADSDRSEDGLVKDFHSGFSMLLEEVDEFKQQVWKKKKNQDRVNMVEELIQVSSIAQRIANDLLKNEVKQVCKQNSACG